MNARVLSVSLSSIALLIAGAAHAQPPPASAAPASGSSSASACAPACRTGFVCVQAQCVSACNPVCGTNEVCTASGECVSKTPAATPTTAPATAPASPPVVAAAATPPSAAAGEPSAPAAAEAPQPTASSPSPSGVHVHDGFYFRAGLGAAVLTGGNVTSPGATQSVDVSGPGPALELAFGGTLPNGLVLGGGIYGMSIPSPSYSQNGASTSGGSAVVSSLGPFADWYFDPTKGLHAQAGVGLAVITAGKGDAFPPKDESGNGFSLFAGLGYEWWVADQLSFGVLARVQYMSGSVKGDGDTQSTSVTGVMPGVLATVTYQ